MAGEENETQSICYEIRKRTAGRATRRDTATNIFRREVEKRETRPYCKSRQESCSQLPSLKLNGAASKHKKGDRQMEAKPAQQNIQDSFLNTARKERHNITIYLVSGVKLTGRIRSFDKYSVVLETSNQEQLIFKHAISTVVIARGAY